MPKYCLTCYIILSRIFEIKKYRIFKTTNYSFRTRIWFHIETLAKFISYKARTLARSFHDMFALNSTSCLRDKKNEKFSISKLFSNFVQSR